MTSPFLRIIQPAYDAVIRPWLPSKIAVCNGVACRRIKLLDRTDHWPEYESALIGAIRTRVKEADTVIEVGGGWGVSTVVAARAVGPAGSVRCFEAAGQQVSAIRETAHLNREADRIEVSHALVGPGEVVRGSVAGAERVNPDSIPPGDVLVLDCEGAEETIVPNLSMDTPFRTVIAVAHECYGVPVEAVTAPLADRGYEIIDTSETEGEAPATLVVAERNG